MSTKKIEPSNTGEEVKETAQAQSDIEESSQQEISESQGLEESSAASPEEPEALSVEDKVAKKANREAARYRTQLREAEERYSSLQSQHTDLIRQFVETQLPSALPPKLFWKMYEPEEFLTTEGNVDTNEVARHSQEIMREFGLVNYEPVLGAGKFPSQSNPEQSLAAAFRPKR